MPEAMGRPPAAARRVARERAVGLLYEALCKAQSPSEVLASLPIEPDAFASGLVVGVERRQEEIDRLVAGRARGWDLERMPMVDLILLRIGTFELLAEQDVPPGVAIAEAVSLAAKLSTDSSAQFVNGVLAALARDLRGFESPVEVPAPPGPATPPEGLAASPAAFGGERLAEDSGAASEGAGGAGGVASPAQSGGVIVDEDLGGA